MQRRSTAPPDASREAQPDDEPLSLVARLRQRTHALHTVAERSGFVSEIVRGRGNRDGYVLFLRNLLPAYEQLESGLERHRDSRALAGVAWAALARSPAIEHDLSTLAGPGWRRSVSVLPSATAYASHVSAAASGNGERLIAHAYVRYMGDLSGGQTLKRVLARSLGLGPESMSFYDFPSIPDLARFKSEFRAAVDAAGAGLVNGRDVLDEAAVAFQLNIDLSEAVQASTRLDARETLTPSAG